MKVHLLNQQKDLMISLPFFRKIIQEVVRFEGHTCDEVSVYFVTGKKISMLHEEFFNDPSITDCISFPMDVSNDLSYRILGEVFVCPNTALSYATANKKEPLREIVLYVIHGLLHLMGYDDIKKNERAQMRRAERRHLKHLEALNLIRKE